MAPWATFCKRPKGLTAEQVQSALDYQQQHGVRFGEAAVALGFAVPTMWSGPCRSSFATLFAPI